ncbi:MAG TPA: hypothetical protein PK765_05145 [bacterium]|nr:hypothetical protein [bacterium]
MAVQAGGGDQLRTSGFVGTLSSPGQGEYARISDTTWQALGSVTRFNINSGQMFYARYG